MIEQFEGKVGRRIEKARMGKKIGLGMILKMSTAVASHTFYSNLLVAYGNRQYFMSYFAISVTHEFLNNLFVYLFERQKERRRQKGTSIHVFLSKFFP